MNMIPNVFILTLEDAVARRARLIAEFEVRGIPYEIWHAIDGRMGLPPEYEAMIDRAKLYLTNEALVPPERTQSPNLLCQ